MDRSPREVAELVRQMVAGEGVVFADLFAEDGVLRFPFAPPGMPREIRGREAIRAARTSEAGRRSLLVMDGVELRRARDRRSRGGRHRDRALRPLARPSTGRTASGRWASSACATARSSATTTTWTPSPWPPCSAAPTSWPRRSSAS